MVVQMGNLAGRIEPGYNDLPGGVVEIVEKLPELAPDMGIVREKMYIVDQESWFFPETFGQL
jgi:hypothetical protein